MGFLKYITKMAMKMKWNSKRLKWVLKSSWKHKKNHLQRAIAIQKENDNTTREQGNKGGQIFYSRRLQSQE